MPVNRSEKLSENQARSASAGHEPSALRSEAEASSIQTDVKRVKTQDTAEELKTVGLAVEKESISHESIAAGVLLALKSECELNKAVLDSTGLAIFNKYFQRLEHMLGKI